MKKLQSNYTTPEQSKRLLELGVPKMTADCYYLAIGYDPEKYGYSHYPYFITCKSDIAYLEINIPCWSVGRLMEIIRICNLTAEKPWVYIKQDNISEMITAITDGVNNRMLDFSKLEE